MTDTSDLPLWLESRHAYRDTRREARPTHLEAALLRRRVLQEYRSAGEQGLTPDQAASRLHLSVLTVRPRCCELQKSGFLVDTGRRDKNRSGKRARVLRATMPEERSDVR